MRSVNPHTLGTTVSPVKLDEPTVHHLEDWIGMSHPERLAVLRQIAESSGRDPRIRGTAVRILQEANVPPRDYAGQVEALHRWVQANIYYVNEPDEVFQDPLFTLEKRYGDCDDQQLLLMAFYESIALPWRFVISGWKTSWFGKRTPYRWIEGTPYNGEPNFDHIYGMVGYPPGRPTEWKFVEPTLPVPTGWDVVGAASKKAPSLGRWFGSSVPGTTATVTTTALAPIGEQGILARLFAKERVLELAAVAATAIVSAIASQIALDAYNRWKAKRK